MLKKMKWWLIAELLVAIEVIVLEIFGFDKHAFVAVIVQEIITIIFFHKIIHQLNEDEKETRSIESRLKALEEVNKAQQEEIEKLKKSLCVREKEVG